MTVNQGVDPIETMVNGRRTPLRTIQSSLKPVGKSNEKVKSKQYKTGLQSRKSNIFVAPVRRTPSETEQVLLKQNGEIARNLGRLTSQCQAVQSENNILRHRVLTGENAARAKEIENKRNENALREVDNIKDTLVGLLETLLEEEVQLNDEK